MVVRKGVRTMGKRPDTRESVLLAVELLRRIPRRGKVTARELQEQLSHAGIERSVRTIQRQLEMLSDHFHLERDDRSKPYGYRWPPEATALAVPGLTLQESLLLPVWHLQQPDRSPECTLPKSFMADTITMLWDNLLSKVSVVVLSAMLSVSY